MAYIYRHKGVVFKVLILKPTVMSKFHEALKNVKKAPKRSAKEKRQNKRAKRAMGSEAVSLKKVFEHKKNENQTI